MAYTKEQRKLAKEQGLHLVTIDAGGMVFSGPVPDEQREDLMAYMLKFLERRREWLKSKEAPPKEA